MQKDRWSVFPNRSPVFLYVSVSIYFCIDVFVCLRIYTLKAALSADSSVSIQRMDLQCFIKRCS